MLNLKLKIMKRTGLFFAASLLVLGSFTTSCKKDDLTDPMVSVMQDDDQTAELFDETVKEVDELTMTSTPSKSSAEFAYALNSGSGTRTIETSFSGDTTIKTITFTDFVNGNNENGHIKNGVIIIKILGGPLQATFKRIILLQNFTIDGIKIEGRKEINKTGDYTYSVALTNGKVTFTDGTTYTRECTRTRTWVEGYATPYNIWDDIFSIEGEATGVNRKGNAYTHTITNALVIKNACRWIVQGTIELVAGDKTAMLDYGNGECDYFATITINGEVKEIRLRGRR